MCSKNPAELRAEAIDRLLKKDFNEYKKEFKILLLGTGESGKSTVVKQMVLLHGKGFGPEEKAKFKPLIFQNMMRNMVAILDAMDTLKIPFANQRLQDSAYQIQDTNISSVNSITTQKGTLAQLWADAGVQKAITRRNQFQLSDSTEYFMRDLERIASPSFEPTDQDILRVRDPTTGIHEFIFALDEAVFRMLDVGGQRSERRKWIHCFSDVTSVLFIIAASEYDQTLVEEEGVNRMNESTALFEQIVNYPYFAHASMILFLNKQDILAEKILKSPLKPHFPSFPGPEGDLEAVKKFILGLFKARAPSNHPVFHHFTTAVDTEHMKHIMEAVKVTIITENANRLGVL